jgi:hypothetical protein
MLSPQLRKKVHSLWTLFWTAGISNPLAAIEQITYLLFIRVTDNWAAFFRARWVSGQNAVLGNTVSVKG